jgi:predicted aspartyl protease
MKHLVILAFLALAMRAGAAPCTPLAHWTLEPDWYGGPTVVVSLGGKPLSLLVDTGGVQSMLTGSTVAELKLKPQPIRGALVTLYGGLQLTEWVTVEDRLLPSAFYVMPDARVPYALSGTLAPDFLTHYDVGFDFAHAKMSLYRPGACEAANAVPLAADASHHLIVTVELDGRKIPAMLDTGASRSDFSLETARQLFGDGLKEEPARRADCERGLATANFHSLSIGGVRLDEPDIVLVPDRIGGRPPGSPRLVLGMNVLRQLHLDVHYSRGEIVITPAEH